MADQDFNIKVVTTADTSGIKQTAAELDALAARTRSGGAIPGTLLAPIPPELLGEPIKEAADASEKLAEGSLLAGANLTRARQEAVVLARELATGGNVTRTLGSLLGSLGIPLTVAGIAALSVVEAIKKATDESKKFSDSLEQEREALSRNSDAWQETAQNVKEVSDLQKLITEIVPQLEASQHRLNVAKTQDLTVTQKILDTIYLLQSFTLAGHVFGIEPTFQKTLEQTKKGFEDLAKAEQEAALFAFQTAQGLKAEFDVMSESPTPAVIETMQRRISVMKELQAGLNVGTAEGAKLYKEYGDQITADEAKLKSLQNTSKGLGSQTDDAIKSSDSQVQHIIANEQAAATARAHGRDKEAEQFDKSAEDYKKSATPQQLQDLEYIHDLQRRTGTSTQPPAPETAAEQIERNRVAFENQLKGTPIAGGESAAGGSAYQDFSNALKNMEAAEKARHEEQMTLMRQIWGY